MQCVHYLMKAAKKFGWTLHTKLFVCLQYSVCLVYLSIFLYIYPSIYLSVLAEWLLWIIFHSCSDCLAWQSDYSHLVPLWFFEPVWKWWLMELCEANVYGGAVSAQRQWQNGVGENISKDIDFQHPMQGTFMWTGNSVTLSSPVAQETKTSTNCGCEKNQQQLTDNYRYLRWSDRNANSVINATLSFYWMLAGRATDIPPNSPCPTTRHQRR